MYVRSIDMSVIVVIAIFLHWAVQSYYGSLMFLLCSFITLIAVWVVTKFSGGELLCRVID
jgi:hypothetical protein